MSISKAVINFGKDKGYGLEFLQKELTDIEENIGYDVTYDEIDPDKAQESAYTLAKAESIDVTNSTDFTILKEYIEWLEEQYEENATD